MQIWRNNARKQNYPHITQPLDIQNNRNGPTESPILNDEKIIMYTPALALASDKI